MTVRTNRAAAASTATAQSEQGQVTEFATIIHHLAEEAKTDSRFEHGRIGRAVGLLLHPDRPYACWHWDTDYMTLNLLNGDGTRWYRVTTRGCGCKDYEITTLWCKHRLAREMLTKAEAILLR